MILGITGDFEKGKRSILNLLVSEFKERIDYEPLPSQFEKYSKQDIDIYFKQISNRKKDIILIDEIENMNQFRRFKEYFDDDFKIFSVSLSSSVKYLSHVKKSLKKSLGYFNRKPFQEYRDSIENRSDDYSKLMKEADLQIVSTSKSTKGLESEVLDYIQNHNK